LIMKPILDKSMLREATIDSGSLATMSSIIHRMTEKGEFHGMVYRGGVKVGTFAVSVCDCTEPPSAGDLLPSQAGIDLVALDSTGGARADNTLSHFPLRTGGHVVFSVSTGSGGYAVELFCREKRKEPVKVFDSRLLGKGDLFVAHVMRPGSYAIRNIRGKGHADLTVDYPEKEKLARQMLPALVECKDGTMNPAALKIQSVQGLIFSCAQEFRITIELKKPEDRPRPVRPPVTAPAVMPEKKKTAPGEPKKSIRTIRFFG
jgi:hypothetical protein